MKEERLTLDQEKYTGNHSASLQAYRGCVVEDRVDRICRSVRDVGRDSDESESDNRDTRRGCDT